MTLRGRASGSSFLLGLVVLTALFLAIAFWNRFPLVFFDTGGYLTEGLEGVFFPERSPVYSLLLRATGASWSLWPVVVLQSALTAYLVAEVARCEANASFWQILATGAILMLTTGIGWYTGQVEPDCMTALVVLGAYLLLFHASSLRIMRLCLIAAVTALATASHPSHLGLMAGLLLAALGLRVWWRGAGVRLLPAAGAFALALALTLGANYALTRQIFLTRAAPEFVFARLMQDGIVRRLLNDTCPGSGYTLCAHRNRLKTRADAWLWAPDSLFRAEGGFRGGHAEETAMIFDSIRRYPLLQIADAVRDSVRQFFTFKTGDGIVSQEWVLKPGIERMSPGQLAAYLAARQQKERIRFNTVNMIHVTVGVLSLLGLLVLFRGSVARRRWRDLAFPGLILLALAGNAIICATFSNPHDRYQSRVIWLATLVLVLARLKNPDILRQRGESGR